MEIAVVRMIIGISGYQTAVVSPIGGDLPVKTFTSRGHYPNAGSGAYFKAQKTPVLVSTAFSVVPGELLVSHPDKSDPTVTEAAVSYGETGGWATVNKYGTLTGHIIEIKYDHMKGRTPYVKQRIVTAVYQKGKWQDDYGTYSGAEGWLAKWVPRATGISQDAPVTQGTSMVLSVMSSEFEFRLNELTAFQSMEDMGIYPHDYASGFAAAYVEAANGLSHAMTNSIANLLEGVSAVKGMAEALRDPTKAITKLLKEYKDPRKAWLAYRYSYTTTKLDLQEYRSFFEQVQALSSWKSEEFSFSGSFTTDSGISCHCKIKMKVADILPKDIQGWLEKAGFNPNLVNAWDMIPYSFVVDWFLHIGDLLEYIERIGYSITINPTEIWYSAKTSYDGQWVYFRVPGRRLDVIPATREISVSGRTFKMRVADAISLFT